jgi:cyclopropane fatty-acyl-phospholipid synthase-like methyltransferase
MNWQAFWQRQSLDPDPLRQVARLRAGQPLAPDQPRREAQRVADLLSLQPTHSLLDMCCGNGLITSHLAEMCATGTGIDLSEGLLAAARDRCPAHWRFFAADAAAPLPVADTFDRITLLFSFQYFESHSQARGVFFNLKKHLHPRGTALLTDIPDKSRFAVFYPRWQDRLRYVLQKITRQETMGRFWHARELEALARAQGLEAVILPQSPDLPYAHYRFDCLLRHAGSGV